jgi:uncharacterized protein with von Willebrand factor type A (vWA) domain
MRFRYHRLDPDLLERLDNLEKLRRLFDALVLRTSGDVPAALDWMRELQRRGYISEEIDVEAFARVLERDGVVSVELGKRKLTPKALRGLRRGAFELMFRNLRSGPLGQHPTPAEGAGGERLSETRAWRFGDAPTAIDGVGTLREALRRSGAGDFDLRQEDLQVFETEHRTSTATVLLLDVSHSMILYGEDRITPAKQVAMALAELIRTKFPKDTLDLVLFGDEAVTVDVADLPYVGAGPYHTNTRDALRLARTILRRRRHPNRRIVMVTDGKPSAITERGRIYKNPMGLDPYIVNRTLQEAVQCRRERIPITTFMIARDYALTSFVEDLTKVNKGQAYFAAPNDLGSALFVDFLRNRRRRL